MDGDGKVDLVEVFCVKPGNDYVEGNHFTEVIHDDSCEDFLNNVLHFF